MPRRSWLRHLLSLAAVVAFVAYALTRSDAVLAAWDAARPAYLALLSVPALGVLWAQGKSFQRSCREFGVFIGERETLSLAVLTTAGNYVGVLRLGIVAKALYVKRARGISITDTIAMLLGGGVVALLMSVTCGLLLLLCLPVEHSWGGAVAGACIAAGTILMLVLLGRLARIRVLVERHAPDFARTRLVGLIDALRIVSRRRLVLALLGWQMTTYLMATIGFWVGFTLLLDRQLDVIAALALTTVTTLASLAALTPGNVGLQELLIVAMAQSFELGEGSGVVVAASLRLAQIIVIVLLSPMAWRTLQRELRADIN